MRPEVNMDSASSPDPLNDSPTYQSSLKPHRTSRANVRHSLPLRGNSPKKQTFQLDVGDEISPQKIRVTVEADNSDMENMYNQIDDHRSSSPSNAPTNRRIERTTTTRIPLKGVSDFEGNGYTQAATPKRGRGRPRKSAGTPVPSKKRAGTPTRKTGGKRKSIGELVDGDDENDDDFRINQGVKNGRGKGMSRSRSAKGATARKPKTVERSDGVDNAAPVRKGMGRKESALPKELLLPEDHSYERIFGRGTEGSESNRDFDLQSAFSTIRSTTTIEGNVPEDIILARFNPGNETPRRPGWSSPRVIDSQRPLSPRQRADSYPSPSASPEKSVFGDGGEHQKSLDDEDNQYYDEEEEDDVGEPCEFDTILESEGFSMISVASVPSLREHLSSPAPQSERELPKQTRNKSLLSLMHQDFTGNNDSFSSIPEEVLEAATPGRKIQHPNFLAVHNAGINDSFSSIPPDVLKAATPARVKQKTTSLEEKAQSNEEYEDSFSAIPSAILDAATPAAVRRTRPASERLSGPSSRPSSPRKTHSPRLLTPDETPSPPTEPNVEEPGANRKDPPTISARKDTTEATAANSSILHSQLPSSPPVVAPSRYTYTAHLRQHRQFNANITQTPSIFFSSPSLPPPLHAARAQEGLRPALEPSQRPTLAPIARAGRVLQDIVVPSSPRSRSQSLGSPFKSPATDRRSSSALPAAELIQDRLAGPLPRLDLNSQFREKSSQQSEYRQHRSSSVVQEDPFRNNSVTEERSLSPEQDQPYTLELPSQRRLSEPHHVNVKSGVKSLRSEDAMSWQAEEELATQEEPMIMEGNGASTTSIRGLPRENLRITTDNMTSEQRWTVERNDVKKQISSVNSKEVMVIDSEDEESNDAEGEEVEDFGLLLETLNSSSPAVERRLEPAKDMVEKPRRSKIPSPWRKNSKRLVYSDEISQFSSPPSPPLAGRVSLAKDVQPSSNQVTTVGRIDTQQQSDNDGEPSSWQIPQKSNFNSRARARDTGHLDLSALLATSPGKPLPVLSRSSEPLHLNGRASSSKTLSSDSPEAKDKDNTNFKDIAAPGFLPIPQKIGFNPRSRADLSSSPVKQHSFLPSMFSEASTSNQTASKPSLASSPPRIVKPLANSSLSTSNALPAHHTPAVAAAAELFPSVCSPASLRSAQVSQDEKENQVLESRITDWTKSLHSSSVPSTIETPPMQPPGSPVKSCLRTPLKMPSASFSSGFGNTSPSKAVAFVSSSPMPSSPLERPLSSTIWSKDHWRLLDEIVQTWKPEKNSPNTEQRRRNSTRVISKLLGKTVTSQGESMRLEQWHLETVDEFRGRVPGWQEKVIAMRVFALLVGEERRARGQDSEQFY